MRVKRVLHIIQRCFFRLFPGKTLNLPDLLKRFEKIDYVILKADTPYMPDGFPVAYPIGKDLDVLVSAGDYKSALESVHSFLDQTRWASKIEIWKEDESCRFRLMWLGILHYQIHISCNLYLGGLEKEFLQNRIRTTAGYFVPQLRMELLYRGLEVSQYPRKTHHIQFIHRFSDEWDYALAAKFGIEFPLPTSTSMKSFVKQVAKKVLRRLPFVARTLLRFARGYYFEKLIAGRYELCVSPEVLLSAEFKDGEFSRYDTIVRLLTIENVLEHKTPGFSLYDRMQKARGARKGFGNRFRTLLESVVNEGYQPHRCLKVSSDGYLLDGSHRLAFALYCNVPLVSARTHLRRKGNVDYGLHWFHENGFSDEECALIEQRRISLFWEKGLFFAVILWPPVAPFFEEIEREISQRFRILKSREYTYPDQEFEAVARSVYEIDDIAPWKVNKKLSYMRKYEKKVLVVWVEFPNPQYRKKRANNALISTVAENLKWEVRTKYKGRIRNYVYDIVCHIGDNWLHNQEIMKIFDETGA